MTPSFDGRWLLSTGNNQTARLWDATSGDLKSIFLGHEHVVECCVFASASSYGHLAILAGLKKPSFFSNSGEFLAIGSRDKSTRIWDSKGILIKTLTGHDNWVRVFVFHSGGKFLISVSDDKTIRCWDLAQNCKCVKTVDDAHGHFVSCVRWVFGVFKGSGFAPTSTGVNGELIKKDDPGDKKNIRCVLPTGSVDLNVRVFAS